MWSRGWVGDKGGATSGTAILVATSLGIIVPAGFSQQEQNKHSTVGILQVPGFPDIMIASLYLVVGQGMSSCNTAALAAVPATAEQWGVPYFAAGDMNMRAVAA